MERTNETETRIIEAATRVFLEKGYSATNMSIIAEAAGIARPALYYYYRTKDRIFNEILGTLLRSFIPSVLDILRQEKPLGARIDACVNAYFRQLAKNPKLPLFLIREINRDPEFLVQAAIQEGAAQFAEEARSILQKEMDKGTMKRLDPVTVLYSFVGQMTIPFLTQPLFETIFKEERFQDTLARWQPVVADNLKMIFLK